MTTHAGGRGATKPPPPSSSTTSCFSWIPCYTPTPSPETQSAGSVLSYYGSAGAGNVKNGKRKDSKMLKGSKPYKSPDWLKNA